MSIIREDKPVGDIIHLYMEIPQGNSLYSYFYLKQTKMSCLSFSLFCKIEQEGATGPAQGEQVAPVGTGRWQRKGVGG
jgi:hypothetical protein